ncbi:MAG: hypothetical protein WCJ35_14685 [Planctomycetota bacterium]
MVSHGSEPPHLEQGSSSPPADLPPPIVALAVVATAVRTAERQGVSGSLLDLPHVQNIAKMNASPSQPRNHKSKD